MNDPRTFWDTAWNGRRGDANVFAREVLQVTDHPKGKTLLDIGCGDGRDALLFAEAGFHVTAIDYSSSGIDRLKKANPSLTALQQDIRSIDFSTASFDVIYAHLSIHYFDDLTTRRIVNTIHRMLKPGGTFFVKCKSTKDPLYGKGVLVGGDTYDYGHVRHFFSEVYLRHLLRDFRIIVVREYESAYDGKQSSFIEAIAARGK